MMKKSDLKISNYCYVNKNFEYSNIDNINNEFFGYHMDDIIYFLKDEKYYVDLHELHDCDGKIYRRIGLKKRKNGRCSLYRLDIKYLKFFSNV